MTVSGLSYDLCLKLGAVKFRLQVIMPLQNYFFVFWEKKSASPHLNDYLQSGIQIVAKCWRGVTGVNKLSIQEEWGFCKEICAMETGLNAAL